MTAPQSSAGPAQPAHPFPGLEALIPRTARLERVAGGATWSEGPVCLDGGGVLWSDIPGNRLLAWHPERGAEVLLHPSHFQNGHTRDRAGRLYACSHGDRAVLTSDDGGRSWTPLVTHSGGRRLNSPNDLVVAPDGAVWFSDPIYGLIQPHEGYGGEQEQPGCFVYRLDPQTGLAEPRITDMERPNGLALSPDGRTLYVSDTSLTHDPQGHHHIRAYPLTGTEVGAGRTFAVVSPGIPDGFRVDEHGNLWTSSGSGVQVYSPQGERLGEIPVPEMVGNLTFSHLEPYLYIAASTGLYRVGVGVRGNAF